MTELLAGGIRGSNWREGLAGVLGGIVLGGIVWAGVITQVDFMPFCDIWKSWTFPTWSFSHYVIEIRELPICQIHQLIRIDQ